MADPATPILIAEESGTPVGQIRLERLSEDVASIDFAVDPAARGRGVGRWMLGRVAERPPLAVRLLRGEVLEANLASRRAFAAAGYAEVRRDDDVLVFEREVG